MSARVMASLWMGLTVATLAACATGSDSGAPAVSGSAPPPAIESPSGDSARSVETARLVDVGSGRTLYLACSGRGSPTVVLVSGKGERAETWMTGDDGGPSAHAVYPRVAQGNRVCAYDRPGTESVNASGREPGRSTLVPQPTTGTDAARDLNAVLEASGEPGPYVLVGHSYGGDIVRLYAAANPTRVAGLVLDDALSEDLTKRLTPEQTVEFEKLNSPETQHSLPGAETFQLSRVEAELRAVKGPPGVPTIVLSADRTPISSADIASGQLPPFVTQEFADALWSAQLAAQDELAAKFPGAVHITRTNSAHYIHVEQPTLVVDAIYEVIARARGTSTPR